MTAPGSSGAKAGRRLVPHQDPERRGLKVDDWPLLDRRAWEEAQRAGGPLDDSGLAARWSEATRRKVVGTYGRYLGWLERRGLLDRTGSAVTLVTLPQVDAHLRE